MIQKYIMHEAMQLEPSLGIPMLARRLIFCDVTKNRWCVLEQSTLAKCFDLLSLKWLTCRDIIATGYEYNPSPESQSEAYHWCHEADWSHKV